MKTQQRLVAALLLFSMLLSPLGGGVMSAAAVQTVTTDSELAYEPLAQTASVAYEQHENGYTVSLDRASDSVTMNITAAPGAEKSRAAENARMFIHTGVELKPGTTYQVSFSLSAERAQPEYSVCFDGGSANAAYGKLDGRSIEAGGTDQVKYQITPKKENGELVLRLLLGKTEAAGNTLRFSGLAVEEAPENVTGENVVLVDKLDYNAPGTIRFWTNDDSGATMTSTEKSATLTVTKAPTNGAEVWKIKLLVATGLQPEAGKTYRIRADVKATASREYEVCYNSGDTEKGYDVLYSQRLSNQVKTLDRKVYVPTTMENPGELILQLSLGKLQTGDKVTISNIIVEEAVPKYVNALASDFAYDTTYVVEQYDPNQKVVTSVNDLNVPINWLEEANVWVDGGELATSSGKLTMNITEGGTRVFHAKLCINTEQTLEADTQYRVTFKIRSDRTYPGGSVGEGDDIQDYGVEILYGKEGADSAYGGFWGRKLDGGKTETISHQFTTTADNAGKLKILFQLGGTDGNPNTVTVSNLRLEKVGDGTETTSNLAAGVAYPFEVSPEAMAAANFGRAGVTEDGQWFVRDKDTAGQGTISGDGDSVTMTFTGTGVGAWKHGLIIKDVCELKQGAEYEVSYFIKANKETKYTVSYNKEREYNPDGQTGFENVFNNETRDDGSKRETNELTATSEWQEVKYNINATTTGSLLIRWNLGLADGDTEVSIKGIDVKLKNGGGGGGTEVTQPTVSEAYPETTDPGNFSARDSDKGADYGIITGDGKSAVMTFKGEGNGTWARGLVLKDICDLANGTSYEVSYKIWASKDMRYAVSYNKEKEYGDGYENAFNSETGDDGKKRETNELDAKPEWQEVKYNITAADSGKLLIRWNLGLANGDTIVAVKDIQVTGNPANLNVSYPEGNLGSFFARDRSNHQDDDSYGIVTGDKKSTMMLFNPAPGDGSGDWKRGLIFQNVCDLSQGAKYEVSYDIWASQNIKYTVDYNKEKEYGDGFEHAFNEPNNKATDELDAKPEWTTEKYTINAATDGKLLIRWNLGLANGDTMVQVKNVKVELTDDGNGGTVFTPPTVTYPDIEPTPSVSVNPGDFRIKDNRPGTLTGDGEKSATLTFTSTSNDDWAHGLCLDNVCNITAGKNYVVKYTISADHSADYTVSYNNGGDYESYQEVFGKAGSFDNPLHVTKTPQTVEYPINNAPTDGNLWIRWNLGWAQGETTVTVSDIEVYEIEYPISLVKSFIGYSSIRTELASEAEEKGWTSTLDRYNGKVVYTVNAGWGERTNYYAKLYIDSGLRYDTDKNYRMVFDIEAKRDQEEFVVIAGGVDDELDVRGTWGLSLKAGEKQTVATRPVPAGMGGGKLEWRLELGRLDRDSNTFTISNIRIEEVGIRSVLTGMRTEGTATFDAQPGYTSELIREKDSASLRITETPSTGMEAWKAKMFLDTGVTPRENESYRVIFDVQAEDDMDFEVCYNRKDEEKGYDAIFGLHAAAGQVKTIEKVFAVTKGGRLKIQLSLGMVKAPNVVKVSNIKVERITYSYTGKSALPAAVDYHAPGAVSYWAHEDYTTKFTNTADAITTNITAAPAKGAEPWKIKLFLDTGAVLQPGKYYKVTANVTGSAAQDYEICYNNGGIEMGYDALGGLHLESGKQQRVERIISVPADKKDASNLMLQFNLGKTSVANAITVSGVKVEEVSLTYADMMEKNFSYTADGAVSVWTNTDYTAALEGSGDQATLHITGVPSTGAEVWKVQMLVSTGAVLSAGKTYLVRADLLAANAQNYEVCFNNEETEKGFDALYGQSIAAGVKTTVERKISVPDSMTDAGELVLQFSVGGAVTNDITVSGVSVQELNFGTSGSGNPASDTVIKLNDAAGKLDVTGEKLTYKMTKISSVGKDNAITITGANLRAGDVYTVAFTARADKNLTGTFAFNQANGSTTVISEPLQLTPEETTYSFTTAEQLSEGGFYDLLWQFGSADNQKLGSADVEISNITVYSPSENLEITRGTQNVTVNGKAVTPDSYNINGTTYFKLRDLAMLLNDTDAQFVVRNNKKSNLISLTTGKPYTPVGGELTAGEDQSASCVRNTQNIAVNGKQVKLKAYTIGGNMFVRLQDLGALLGFKMNYAAESNTVVITSPLTPDAQEKAHAYDLFFLPEIDGASQPYVGDTMPFYDNGVYYIYYLKDGGDSYNHSVYVTTTKDFVHYTELDNPVLSASRADVQDSWIGTGSVVKVDNTYYFFYTGFNASGSQEYHEKIMVAKSSSPTSFEKVSGWEIVPPASLGQKNDFRDPQAYYDPETQTISLTVTASQDGAARILKYTLGKDLQNVTYDGIIFTDPTGAFWNLECSDTFQIGNKWYLTYSGQEDTLWYAMADSRFGPYSDPARLEGKLFYAAKHVEDGKNSYMVGWARRANSASSTQEVAGWAGNVAVQQLRQLEDGRLTLVPVDSIVSAFKTQQALALGTSEVSLTAGPGYSYKEAFTSYESFMLRGEFTYSGTGSFGLAFDFNGSEDQYKLVSLDPAANKLSLSLNGGAVPITETQAALQANQKHSFTYIQDGSVGIFYLDGQAPLTVRLYGVTDKPIYLFAENNSVTFTSLQQYTR